MEEIFCDFPDFFPNIQEKHRRKQQKAHNAQHKGCDLSGKPQPGRAQEGEIQDPAQPHAQRHEEPELPCPRHAAQQKEQAGKEQAEEHIPQQQQFFQPEAPPELAHQVIHQPQGRAAGQTQQCLQPLYAGIDLHQPRSLPSSPRRGWVLSL